MEPRLFRILVLDPDDSGFARLAAALRATGSVGPVLRATTVGEALAALVDEVDVCFAPSAVGADPAASLTLALSHAESYVPVVAVVDTPGAGFEAIAEEGAADFVLLGELHPIPVGRALLVSRARAQGVAAYRRQRGGLDAVLAAAGAVVASLDRDGRIREFAAAASAEAAFRSPQRGHLLADGFEPEFRPLAVAAVRSAAGGAPGRFEQQVGGCSLLWTIAPAPGGLRAVAVDVSEVRRVAHRADLLQALIDGLIERTGVVLFAVDGEGQVLLLRGGDAVLTSGLAGASIVDVFEGRPEVEANVRRALEGEAVDGDATLRDGRRYRVHYTPLPLGPSECPGVLGIAVGRTEERRDGLLLHAALALTDDLLLTLAPDGTPVHLSPALDRLLRQAPSDGRQRGERGATGDALAVLQASAAAVRPSEPWRDRIEIPHADGTVGAYDLDGRAVVDGEGARVGAVLRLVPVSEAEKAGRVA